MPPTTATTPTVLRATNSADLLAALPRLTGLDAPNSCHIVFFRSEPAGLGNRTVGSVRLALPSEEHLRDMEATLAWTAQVAALAARAESAVIVLDTTAGLPLIPAITPFGLLAMLVKLAGSAMTNADSKHKLLLEDLLLVGANGWVSLLGSGEATLRPLEEVTSSPLHDPEHKTMPLDEWRAAHPGSTTEDLTQIDMITQTMTDHL